ncbi:embryonal Fyn-associated substrate isoform 2-T3 [Discoglossus pictus]
MLVLERDAPSLGGWWRCSLRGQQGIAPGNRLRLLPESLSQENEYQAPRALGVTVEPGNQQTNVEAQNVEADIEVYEIPPAARLCISSQATIIQEEIYNSPRLVGAPVNHQQEVYDTPSTPRINSNSASDTYDSPALQTRAVAFVAPQPVSPQTEEIPEDIYDVPPTFQNLPHPEDEDDEGVYSLPSNLKRVSGLQNLYEAPEDILSTGQTPETVEPPRSHRLSVSSAGSARSVDSTGSRESSVPPPPVWEPRPDVALNMEALRVLHQDLQMAFTPINSGLQGVETPKGTETLRDFLGMAQVALLRSCQASDPSLHRQLSGHLEQLEHALHELQDGRTQVPLRQLVQEQSGCIVSLISANAGLLFPRPRLCSSESLSRRPLPALPTASPAPQRKGSIQDRPLPPPPPILPQVPSNSEETDSEYERIQCKDNNHYVHLQGTVSAQIIPKPKDKQTDMVQSRLAQETEVPSHPDPSEEDRHLLRFYAAQSRGHLQTLETCVGTFLGSASSQPPRVFVGHGKQLVIAAHKLVFIGDTLGRLLGCAQLQAQLAAEGGALCQALKEVVLATKEAAALYPSPTALKAMASSVSVLCTHAHSFTDLLQNLSS